MMNFNKAIASSKTCTCIGMTALGALIGLTAAKLLVTHCRCVEGLTCKARRAEKAIEERLGR